MSQNQHSKHFEMLFQPHMRAAYNLARWLTGDATAARDVVQESAVRAFRFLHRFDGGNAKAWLLSIVRTQSYSWLKAARATNHLAIGDELAEDSALLGHNETPEQLAICTQNVALLQQALANLPAAFRAVIVLKELEGMAYKDIAEIMDIPLGTVMSRLARARAMLSLEVHKLVPHA